MRISWFGIILLFGGGINFGRMYAFIEAGKLDLATLSALACIGCLIGVVFNSSRSATY